jgi:23S rRNA (adenine2030-N6)-methyltransferase
VLAAELLLRAPTDPARLNGCGLLVANAPFRFGDEAGAILAELLHHLGSREPGEGWTMTRIVEE